MKIKIGSLKMSGATSDSIWGAVTSVLAVASLLLPGSWKPLFRAVASTLEQIRAATDPDSDSGSKITADEVEAIVAYFRDTLIREVGGD